MNKHPFAIRVGILCALLCALCLTGLTALAAEYPESAHPYEAGSDRSWSYTHEAAADYLEITFSADTETEYLSDYIYITDNTGATQAFTGTALSGGSVHVIGNSFTIRLVSDGVEEAYGFRIESVTAVTGDAFGQVSYVMDGGRIVGVSGGTPGEALTIPAVINGNSVTEIGTEAFAGTAFSSVTVPSGVTLIDDFAFSGCPYLTSVVLPDTVTDIYMGAFENCTALTSINLPEGLEQLDFIVFFNCSSLTSLTIPDSVYSIDSSCFSGCTSLKSITLPRQMRSLGEDLFSGCISLTHVTLPEGIQSLGALTFSGCTSLQSITIPGSVTRIMDYCFSGCTSLQSVTIPDSVTMILGSCFKGCTSLPSITLPDNIEEIYSATFEGYNGIIYASSDSQTALVLTECDTAFMDSDHPGLYLAAHEDEEGARSITVLECDESVTSVTFPANTTEIGYAAFADCASLTSVVIPDSVTTLGELAFNFCSSLVSAKLPDGLTTIPACAFDSCTSLTSVNIPDSVTSIDMYAFFNCEQLPEITIPAGVTEIKVGAFQLCSSLKTVTIPDSVMTLGPLVFQYCYGLESAVLSGNLTSLEPCTFRGCDALKEITIPAGILSIGENCFAECYNLKAVTFPMNSNETLTIHDTAFMYAPAVIRCYPYSSADLWARHSGMSTAYLSDISLYQLPADLTTIETAAFAGNPAQVVVIPANVTSIQASAFTGCSSLLRAVFLGDTVSISDDAFAHCGDIVIICTPDSDAAAFAEEAGFLQIDR